MDGLQAPDVLGAHWEWPNILNVVLGAKIGQVANRVCAYINAQDIRAATREIPASGIDTQVLYPNAIGIGGQNIVNSVNDPVVVRLCVELYNDAMAEVQEQSNNRLLPMPIIGNSRLPASSL